MAQVTALSVMALPGSVRTFAAKTSTAVRLFRLRRRQSYVDGAVVGKSYIDGASRGESYVDGAAAIDSEPE